MKILPILLLLGFLSGISRAAEEKLWADFEGQSGPGKGKHIVLLSGDEEYRSEEGLPMLAKILSQRHGFSCRVLFSLDPQTGEIDPNNQHNEPGTEALKSADLCIMLLRFRAWPDEQMKPFAEYVASGKPIIGLRTATHAFAGLKGEYAKFNSFGKDVLGERWVNHWGRHKSEATRGVIEPGAESDPLLRGVSHVFGDTDVYEAYPPADAKILLRGQVLKGMKPEDEAADYRKKRSTDKEEQGVNDPMMPIAWTREIKADSGTPRKTLCTTMGSATDLANEGLRRLIVNAVYSYTGLEVPQQADVTLVGDYKPTFYSPNLFVKHVKPADIEGKHP